MNKYDAFSTKCINLVESDSYQTSEVYLNQNNLNAVSTKNFLVRNHLEQVGMTQFNPTECQAYRCDGLPLQSKLDPERG